MMFQSYALFPHMSVYKNICYGLKIQKLPKQEIKDRTEQIIDLMQIRGLEPPTALQYIRGTAAESCSCQGSCY